MSSWNQTKMKRGFNEEDLQWKTTFDGRQPPMEDDLKIGKFEYLEFSSNFKHKLRGTNQSQKRFQ